MGGATFRARKSRASLARYAGSSTKASAAARTSLVTLFGTPFGRPPWPFLKPTYFDLFLVTEFRAVFVGGPLWFRKIFEDLYYRDAPVRVEDESGFFA
jgi:hypothetical protein